MQEVSWFPVLVAYACSVAATIISVWVMEAPCPTTPPPDGPLLKTADLSWILKPCVSRSLMIPWAALNRWTHHNDQDRSLHRLLDLLWALRLQKVQKKKKTCCGTGNNVVCPLWFCGFADWLLPLMLKRKSSFVEEKKKKKKKNSNFTMNFAQIWHTTFLENTEKANTRVGRKREKKV